MPKKRRPNKGESLEEISTLLASIEKGEEAVELAEIQLDAKRDEAKTAKGVWLTRVAELRELVRTRKRWAEEMKRQPLLNQKKNPEASALPAPAVRSEHIGIVQDFTNSEGKIVLEKGTELTGYFDGDGQCFVDLKDKNRIFLRVEDFAILDSPTSQNGDGKTGNWRRWKISCLTEIDPPLPAGKLKCLEEAKITTMGKLIDTMGEGENQQWWWKQVPSLGETGGAAVAEAIAALRISRPEFQQA